MRRQPQVIQVDLTRRTDRSLGRADALLIRQEAAALREKKRQGRTVYRLRRHLAPWYAAAVVAVVGCATWAVEALAGEQTAYLAALGASGVAAFLGWMAGHRTRRWRRRINIAAWVVAAWLPLVTYVGPAWWPFLALTLATVWLSARWWQSIRIPNPKAPVAPEPEKVAGPIEERWADNVADTGGALPGSRLTNKNTEHPNRTTWDAMLRPGKQTTTNMLSAHQRIASGLMIPTDHLVLEPHPNHMPNMGRVTVVDKSPIEATVAYKGSRITGDHQHLIQLGPYADGDGHATWRMWQPGEKPMAGSWLSGFIVGGTGIGKSRLMELLAAGYMASGYSVVWFADPQGGASSPALREYADWYVDASGVPVMLAALERIAQWRETEMASEHWSRFDPSPQRPGIVVFLDECHVTFGQYGKRWADLARKTQKVGISLVGLTQYASLDNLGGKEALRAALLANAIVMKTNSRQTKSLISGLDFDSEQLPKIPGFGYIVRVDDSGRTAPFRAEYVAEPEHWFARYPMAALDALSVNAAGEPYKMRRETAAELMEDNRRKVEQMRSSAQLTLPVPEDAPQDVPQSAPAAPKLQVVQDEPTSEPAPTYGRDAILDTLSRGPASPKALQQCTGLSETRVRQLTTELKADGRVEQTGRGIYRLTE